MTYILQALKRAEEDRRAKAAAVTAGPARPLAAPAGGLGDPHTPAGRPLRLWLVSIGVGIAVNALVFGAVFVVSRPSTVAVVTSPPAPETKAEPPAVQPSTGPGPTAPAPAAAATPAPAPSPDVVDRARTGMSNGRAPQGDTKGADTTLASVQPMAPDRPAPPAPPAPVIAPAPVPPAPPARAMAPDLPTPPAYTPSPDPRAPLWRNSRGTAARRLQRLPHVEEEEGTAGLEVSKLRIEVLVWAPDPRERMVYLNGRKYVEGETIEKGTVVEQIVQNGVVLIHQGQRVRLQSEAR